MKAQDITEIFSSRLRNIRRLNDMTQIELAVRANLQPSHISHFESGRRTPSIHSLRAICRALEVQADYLLGLK